MVQIETVKSMAGDKDVTTRQEISFLNQIEGRLDNASTIAELQAVNAEPINFQRWDALLYQIDSIEAVAVNDLSEQSGMERSNVE